MNLFEEEEKSPEDDKEEEDVDKELGFDLEEPSDAVETFDSDSGFQIGPDSTVRELAKEAGLLDDEEMPDLDVDDDDEEDVDEFNFEGLFENELDNEIDVESIDDSENEVYEESYRRDRVLEIDENMLRREIGRMKTIREGEAKDMASHFGGGSLEGEVFVDGVELNKLHEMKIKAAKVVRMNRMLESKLSQYKKALRGMKSQLTEMNLFNAKLLYANKLMQNRDLSIKQQRHIVESLDDAKTLGEAKILFESLSKSLISRSNRQGGNLTESAVRRPLSSSSRSVRSSQAKPINESVALDRWATLAGIKN